MKQCRYCAEEIQDAAILCRFCGKAQQPPKEEKDLLVRGLAALLVFGVTAALVLVAMQTEAAGAFKASMHKLTAPTSDSAAVEVPEPSPPPPPPPPPPAIFEVANTAGPQRMEAGQYLWWRFELADPRPCRLRGHVSVLDGGSHDVDIFVLDEDAFANFQHGQDFYPAFSDRRTAARTLDLPLPSQRTYYFVVSNRFSAFTPKLVSVDRVTATCDGDVQELAPPPYGAG